MESFLSDNLMDIKFGVKAIYPSQKWLSVNPLYSKCEILKYGDNIKLLNFLFEHDSIKINLPTLCDSK